MTAVARLFAPIFGIPCDIQKQGMLYVLDVPLAGDKSIPYAIRLK